MVDLKFLPTIRLSVGRAAHVILRYENKRLYVFSLYVEPAYRRNHYATLLMGKCLKISKITRLPVYLTVKRKNKPAVALYTKLGFVCAHSSNKKMVMIYRP